MGGLSYSSVFKTGLEEKKQEKRVRRGLLISLPMKESFSPASCGPTEQRTVFITRGPSPLRPERGVCVQASVVGHSSTRGHRRAYGRSDWWDRFRLGGWGARV